MAVTRSTDRQTFLAYLRQSGLLSDEQLAKYLPSLPDTDRGRALARAMVEHGVLTKFQAEMVLAGRTSGFILGQYRILDQLGRGGMGRIFKAEHLTMNRIVALKVMATALINTPRARQMFQREVRAAARLVHPNIVTAYDANQAGDRYYLVMEFVNGPNLDELVQQQGPLPVGQACDFIRQAAAGLQYASEHGMVHRDIKPSNLLVQRPVPGAASATDSSILSRGWVVKILDFGLARLGAAADGESGPDSIMTNDNAVVGTPDYISPEQTRDLHKVDIRSDLYSLGCTFYFLLTGTPPFVGGTAMEKMVRHNTEEPPPLEQRRPDLPPKVVAIVRRLMAKAPDKRYSTPQELAEDLTPLSTASVPKAWAAKAPGAIDGSLLDFSLGEDAPPDEVAMVGTLPGTAGITPNGVTGVSAEDERLLQMERLELRRTQIALASACLIVFGLIALLTWLALRH